MKEGLQESSYENDGTMSENTHHKQSECPVNEIAAYIDGELDQAREIEIGAHFDGCKECSGELNLQKQFLCGLDNGLRDEAQFELPASFTRSIIANAESSVTGLRHPAERFNALFIFSGLFLFVLFAMGSEAGRLFQGIASAIDQIAIVGGFFGHLVYAALIGMTIILRSLASQLSFDVTTAMAVTTALLITSLLISRMLLQIRRA